MAHLRSASDPSSFSTKVDFSNISFNGLGHNFTDNLFNVLLNKGILPTQFALPPVDVIDLSDHMKEVPHFFINLHTLNLTCTGDDTMSSVADILAIPTLRNLEVLILKPTYSEPSTLHLITDAISKGHHLQCLRVIIFNQMAHGDEDNGLLLGNMLRLGKHLMNLQVLSLRDIGMRAEGMRYLADAVKASADHLHSLKVINVNDNPLGDEGVRYLAHCLLTLIHLATLEEINIARCGFGNDGLNDLTRCLNDAHHLVSLKYFSVSENAFNAVEHHSLCRALVRYPTLERFNSSSTVEYIPFPRHLPSLHMLARLKSAYPFHLGDLRNIRYGKTLAEDRGLRKNLALQVFTIGLKFHDPARSSLRSFTLKNLYERQLVRMIAAFV